MNIRRLLAPDVALASLLTAALLLPTTAPAAPEIVSPFEGDPIPIEVEQVYTKGIEFLVGSQSDDGAWGGQSSGGRRAVMRGADTGNNVGVSALCLLAILAHGDDPNSGPYAKTIKAGFDYILQAANPDNGYLGASMYNHGFATLALAEAYGQINDPRIGPALRKAVDLILASQDRNPQGAWRYSPESNDADTTVSGAQMVALFAARNAGLAIPEEAIQKGLDYYKRSQNSDGGFGYTGQDGSSSSARTAIGGLVFALARQKGGNEFKAAVLRLRQVSGYDSYASYALYYTSQVFYHAGPKLWGAWNTRNVKEQTAAQQTDGRWNDPNFSDYFGTACTLLSLALDYRLLPIYER